MSTRLRTERLLLRDWRDEDRAPFAAMNADPRVMEYFPATLDRAQSDAMIDRIAAGFDANGYGLWAVQVEASGEFIGFTGLSPVGFTAPFTPAVEVGWRLAASAWGNGYATEAALAAARHAFEDAGLPALVSFTAAINERSSAVMRRIGMRRDPAEDFAHPRLPADHRLSHHVLYRLDHDRWRSSADPG